MNNKKSKKNGGMAAVKLLCAVLGVGVAYAAQGACESDPLPCELSDMIGHGCHTPTRGVCCQYIQFRCINTNETFYQRYEKSGICGQAEGETKKYQTCVNR